MLCEATQRMPILISINFIDDDDDDDDDYYYYYILLISAVTE